MNVSRLLSSRDVASVLMQLVDDTKSNVRMTHPDWKEVTKRTNIRHVFVDEICDLLDKSGYITKRSPLRNYSVIISYPPGHTVTYHEAISGGKLA
jgi:hypothetical protein